MPESHCELYMLLAADLSNREGVEGGGGSGEKKGGLHL